MDLALGTAMTAEKHFSHDFRMPFTTGQVFGTTPVDYSKLSAWELDRCLVHTRIKEGELFPCGLVRKNLAHLLEGVQVKVSPVIKGKGGNLTLGLFTHKKTIMKGAVVGIYSGVATRREGADSLYLFQLDHIRLDGGGQMEKTGRVIDGSPTTLDPWTIYGRINEWVWKSRGEEVKNNCEVLPGGTIIASRNLRDEEIFINYGSEYPWYHVKIPLLREIPFTLRKILVACSATRFEEDMHTLEGVISGMSSEAGYIRALEMKESGLAHALAAYIDGRQPDNVGHFSSKKSSYDTVLDSSIVSLRSVALDDHMITLTHSVGPVALVGEDFVSWLFRVLMFEPFFLGHVFRYADYPGSTALDWPDMVRSLAVKKSRPSRNQATWQRFFARVIDRGLDDLTTARQLTFLGDLRGSGMAVGPLPVVEVDSVYFLPEALEREFATIDLEQAAEEVGITDPVPDVLDGHTTRRDVREVLSVPSDDWSSFDPQIHTTDSPATFVPDSRHSLKGKSHSSNLRLRLDFSGCDEDVCALHGVVRAWQSGADIDNLSTLIGDRLTCEIKIGQAELKKMIWDSYGWMTITEAEFRSPSDLLNLEERLQSLGLGSELVARVVGSYINEEDNGVDLDEVDPTSMVLSKEVLIWAPGGRTWAHPLFLVNGKDLRLGASLQTIINLCDAKHVMRLPRCRTRGYANQGFSGLIYPISAVDVRSAFKEVLKKFIVKISGWARLLPPPLLADYDLRVVGRQILSHSDDEGSVDLGGEKIIGPTKASRLNRKRTRKTREPAVPGVVDPHNSKLDSDLVVVHMNCGGCNTTKLSLLLEMMIEKKADLMCLSDTGETPGPRNALESHARHILNRHASSWGIHTIKAISPPSGVKSHPPGGALVIFNLSRLSRVRINSVVDYGLLFEVSFDFGESPVLVSSTYFPPRRWGPDIGLSSIEAQILGVMDVQGDAVDYMKSLVRDRLLLANASSAISIIGGDFNSNFHAGDGYKIASLMTSLEHENASSPQEMLLPSFCRKALEQIRMSRIDNVFVKKDVRARVISCSPQPTNFEASDHYPMFTHMRMLKEARPLFGTRTKRNLPRDIHSTDGTAFALFTQQLEEMEIPEEILSSPEKLVEWVSVTSGALACSISKCRHSRSCPNHWSVVAMVILVHLRASLILRRHVATFLNSSTLKKGNKSRRVRHRTLWKECNYKLNVGRMLHQLNKRLLLIPMTVEDLADCNRLILYSQSYWESTSLKKLAQEAEDVYLHFRRLLTTRNILDWQSQLRQRRKEMEDELKLSRTGKVHKYHRKYEDKSFTMEEHVIDGEVISDESLIHDHVTKYYASALSLHSDIPCSALCGSNTTSWRDFELSQEDFCSKASIQGVPLEISVQIWKAMERRPQTEQMTAFQTSVMCPPSLEEFMASIKCRPFNSAAAISGCSYNQIKRWPASWVKVVHVSLCDLFVKRITPEQWKWRYLVLLKKVPNPTLRETRPLMLYEALRKVWWGIFINRIQIYLKASQVLCQDQSAYLYGKDTSICSLHILNALETVMEFQSDLFINSWDLEKAFDSVIRPLLIWGGIRIGIPVELMELMVGMDIGGFTVLRSPKVLRFLHKNGMSGLRTSLLYFIATIGTGQGGVEGPLSWNFVIDILLCALRDVQLKDHFYTRDAMGVNREARGRTFADDILSLLASHDSLQRTSDVVSAFSIMTGIRVSWHKFRCLHIQNSNAGRAPSPESLVVRTQHWDSVKHVQIVTTGDLKHLGVVLDVALLNLTQLRQTMDHLIECSELTLSKSSSMEAKHVHASRSTLIQMVYYSKYMNWTPTQWGNLEKRLNMFYRRLTRNMSSYPSLMLNVQKSQGGLGLQNFLDLVNENKLRLVFMMMGHSSDTSHDISSLIGRSLHSAGSFCSAVTKCPVTESLDMEGERWWITSLIQHLRLVNVVLEKNGVDFNSVQDTAAEPLTTGDRASMFTAGLYSSGELFMVGDDPAVLRDLSLSAGFVESILMNATPAGPLTLRPGQVWASHYCAEVVEIMGFWYPEVYDNCGFFGYDRGNYMVQVIYWKRANSRCLGRIERGQRLSLNDEGGCQSFCTGSGSSEKMTVVDLIGKFSLLLTLSKEIHCETLGNPKAGWTFCRITSLRERAAAAPFLHFDFSTKIPPDILTGSARAQRFYSDGSHKSLGTIADMLTGEMKIIAGGAVVSYNEAGGSFLVKVDCSGEDHQSAYSPELLSLGLSIEMAHHTLDRDGLVENFSDCIGAIQTMTRVQRRDFKYSPLSHMVLGLCVRNMATISHVKGHPERYKQRSDWNMNDYGIDLADRGADDSIIPDARITDWQVAEMLSGAIPFRLVRTDREHLVAGSLCATHPRAVVAPFAVRRCPVFRDIKVLMSLGRRAKYFEERQGVHSSSSVCDASLLSVIHMRKFDWTKCCIDVAIPMFRLKHLNLSKLAVVNRLVLDKHYETNIGKREGYPHQCPLCNEGNLNIFHVLQNCTHGEVSHTRYMHTVEILAAITGSDGVRLETGAAILDLISSDTMAGNILRGVIPQELFEQIKTNPRLQVRCEGVTKSKFFKFLTLVGSRSSAVCASFLRLVYEKQRNLSGVAFSTVPGGVALRRADGSLVRKRRRGPNLFTMAQFKPPKKVAASLDAPAPTPLINRIFSVTSECGSYGLSVDYSIYEDMIGPQLLIDDLVPDSILLSNLLVQAYTLQVGDPRGDRLLATYGSDTGYSGYSMLHSVLGDQEAIDMADVRCLKEMRVFVRSLRVMASTSMLKEEIDCVLTYMNGVIGCWHRTLPETVGRWISFSDIREIAGTENIFAWVYQSGCLMEYSSAEKISLSCLRCLDSMDHVLSHRRMYRKILYPSQADVEPLISSLEVQISTFLKEHIDAKSQVVVLEDLEASANHNIAL